MKIPFLKSLKGKFVLRTVLIALLVAAVIGGLAVASMRSLSNTATTAVNNASGSADAETLAALEALADDVSSASSSLVMFVAIAALATTIAAAVLALSFANKVVKPLVKLRAATKISTGVLPEIAEANSAGLELPALPTIALSSGDELQDLADSIDYLQRTAADLAVNQAPATAEPQVDGASIEQLKSLGGRSHALLGQQMRFIDEMEKDEANPANLQRLFKVDHLATRMRRNAESFLVLAGDDSPRTLNSSVSMHQVVQAASSEIEHFDRISISDITGVSVDGAVATDLAHLLAELLENATLFAPADAMTTVGGRATDHGYMVDIIDHGPGMAPEAMAAATTRFSGGAVVDGETPEGIGHEIVARLAQRHGVALRLLATPTGGLTAQVHIPQAALAAPAQPKMQPVYTEVEPVVVATTPAPAPAPVAEPSIVEAPTADLSMPEPAPHAVADVLASEPEATLAAAAPTELIETPPAEQLAETALGEHGLTSEQQAAIDWAIEEGWGDSAPTSADPSALADLDATMATSPNSGTVTDLDAGL